MSSLSPPGWALAAMSMVTIVTQIVSLYDPSAFMNDYQIGDIEAARLIAFLLILVNVYDLLAALQDNWTVYRFSVASRIFAATLFWSFGPTYLPLVGVEVGTLAILVVAMYFA